MHKLFQFWKIVAHRQRSWQCSTLEGLPRRCTRPLQPGTTNFFSQRDFLRWHVQATSWGDQITDQHWPSPFSSQCSLPRWQEFNPPGTAEQNQQNSQQLSLWWSFWGMEPPSFSNLTSACMFPLILFVFPHYNLDLTCNGRSGIYWQKKPLANSQKTFFRCWQDGMEQRWKFG